MFLSNHFGRPRSLVPMALVFVTGIAIGLMAAGFFPAAKLGTSQAAAVDPDKTQTSLPAWPRSGRQSVRYAVNVTRVVDGDTFQAQVSLWPGLDLATSVRLRNIDAPERKAACPEEAEAAERSAAALDKILREGSIAIFNIGPDKYHGRVVADAATSKTENVSAALLEAGHARAYAGGRREGWCSTNKSRTSQMNLETRDQINAR